MSYLVLARKYRPKTFEEVIGQEHVAATLKNAIRTNRLAHAYLFSGPRGVGKTTFARILAMSLNCENEPVKSPLPSASPASPNRGEPASPSLGGPSGERRIEASPCNACSSCIEIAESRSMDVYEIDGASNRGIDEIRNLRENVRYVPLKGKYKIYIIDEVHMLTTEAFNALLKTLEEPPKHVLFIFATTEPQKVISTILSRCQRFDFRRLRIQELMDRIHFIAQKEGIKIHEEASRLIALKAEGSMRDGESMLDQLSSYTEATIHVEDVRTVLGLFDSGLLFDLTDRVLQQDGSSALSLLDNLFRGGLDDREFLPEWIGHLRTLLHIQLDLKTDRVLSLAESEVIRYREQAARVDTEKILRIIQIVSESENQMRRSDQPRILLESCIVRLSRLDSTVHLKELLERITGLVEKDPHNSGESIQTVSLPGDTEALWKGLFQRMPKHKRGLSVCLQVGEPSLLNGNTLLVTFPKEKVFEKEQTEEIKNRTLLEDLLREILGRPMRIQCILNEVKGPNLMDKAQEIFDAEVV